MSSKQEFNNITVEWSDAHKFSPAPRHRRRIICNILKKIDFKSCLDVGYAQPYLLDMLNIEKKHVFGCDISSKAVEISRNNFPSVQFEEVDISKETYPGGKQFDLVILSEVLEHIDDWRSAVNNARKMAKEYLLITVPSGRIYNIDKMVGHFRHYRYRDLKSEIEKNGFRVIFNKSWGMPFHTIYKYLINCFCYKKIYKKFTAKEYGKLEKIISNCLYCLFYFNDIFRRGSQLFILAQKDEKKLG